MYFWKKTKNYLQWMFGAGGIDPYKYRPEEPQEFEPDWELPITDEEMDRQDQMILPDITPGSIAVANGEALYRIWASSEIGDNSAFEDARKLGVIYPFDPDYADPVAARIQFHGDTDQESIAAVLQRFDEAAGIPRAELAVATSMSYDFTADWEGKKEFYRTHGRPGLAARFKWPSPPHIVYEEDNDYENVCAHIYRATFFDTPNQRVPMWERVADVEDTTEAMPHQNLSERPKGLMDGAADREAHSIGLMAQVMAHTMDYEREQKLKEIHEEERVQHIGVWQMYETVERMVEDSHKYDAKIQAVEWAIVTNDPHSRYNGVYSRDEQENFWHRPMEIISNVSVQPPEEIINTGPLIDGVRTKRSGWVYRADDVSSTREEPSQDELDRLRETSAEIARIHERVRRGLAGEPPIGCTWMSDYNNRYYLNDDPEREVIRYGDWDAHEVAVARASRPCGELYCNCEPSPVERPSRGTEQVPVERVLREEQNARVPRNRHPKHSRGRRLLPGQVGIALTPHNDSGVLERGTGVHAPTIVE